MSEFDRSPVIQDIRVARDMDATFLFVIKDKFGQRVDITSDTVRFTLLDGPGGTVIYQDSNGSGEHSDPTNGVATFTVARAETRAELDSPAQLATWVYEVRHITAAAVHTICYQGRFTVLPGLEDTSS